MTQPGGEDHTPDDDGAEHGGPSQEKTEPETAEAAGAEPGEGAAASDGDAEEQPQQQSSRRSRREASGDIPSQRLNALPFIIAAVLVIILTGGILWWFLGRDAGEEETVDLERAENPSNGIILADAPPEEWLAGDCLRGFDADDDLAPATIIECDWDYDAQVVHWEDLDGEEYPGEEQVREQAMAACDSAQQEVLDQEAVDAYHPLEGVVVHPDESTWEEDRRVNCLLQRADGEQMNGNFVVDPEEASSAEDFDEEEQPDEGGAEDDGDDEPFHDEPEDDA